MPQVDLSHLQAIHTRRLPLIANCTQFYDRITPYASPRCNGSCLHRSGRSQGDCRAARRVARHDVYVATKRKGTKKVVKTNEALTGSCIRTPAKSSPLPLPISGGAEGCRIEDITLTFLFLLLLTFASCSLRQLSDCTVYYRSHDAVVMILHNRAPYVSRSVTRVTFKMHSRFKV
jgi:hypothetical protein